MPAVTVIVPARDAADTLPACLDALAAQQPVPGGVEVILVDDGSTDATRALAEAHPVVTRVIDGGGRGPGAARNAGAAVAGAEVLAFTDADCIPQPGWLTALLAAVGEGGDVVQGQVVPAGPAGPFDRTVSVGALSGLFETANLAVRRASFAAVGGFEPWLSPKRSKELGEDVWLGWRLTRMGADVRFCAQAVVQHAVFAGTPRTHVGERLRLRFFPELAARIPELRGHLFFARWFLNRRSAQFDLALLALVVTVAARRPLALLAVLPYVRTARSAANSREELLVGAAADAVGCAALLAGSARARSVLL